jgi:hypothetical protein
MSGKKSSWIDIQILVIQVYIYNREPRGIVPSDELDGVSVGEVERLIPKRDAWRRIECLSKYIKLSMADPTNVYSRSTESTSTHCPFYDM